MRKNIFIFSIMFLLSFYLVSAYQFPKPTGYVNDFAGIIDDSYKLQIESMISELEKNTTVEIAVVTINSLEGATIDDYAVNLFKEWGIGKKGKDNGLLILISKEDREYRFEVGYGIEGTLPDILTYRIGKNNFVSNFRNGEYGKGIYEALTDIKGFIENDSSVTASYEVIEDPTLKYFGVIIVLYLIYLAALFFFSESFKKLKPRWITKAVGDSAALISSAFFGLEIFVLVFFFSFWFFIISAFLLAKKYGKSHGGGFERGGGFFGGGRMGGGGFGGFGGGMSGGGGASGRW